MKVMRGLALQCLCFYGFLSHKGWTSNTRNPFTGSHLYLSMFSTEVILPLGRCFETTTWLCSSMFLGTVFLQEICLQSGMLRIAHRGQKASSFCWSLEHGKQGRFWGRAGRKCSVPTSHPCSAADTFRFWQRVWSFTWARRFIQKVT